MKIRITKYAESDKTEYKAEDPNTINTVDLFIISSAATWDSTVATTLNLKTPH